MLKNLLATMGIAVVVKAAVEHYREFQKLKREKQGSREPTI